MTKTTTILSTLVISGILIGTISIGSISFADEDHDSYNNSEKPDSRMYVNSLSFEFNEPDLHDSCNVKEPPCILIDPLDMDNEIFIADPELKNTRTLIQVNVHEQDNFPTDVDDIFEFPECFIVTLANFNGINGILVECGFIDTGIIDVTYSFTGPNQNFSESDDDDDDDDDDD